MKVRVTEYRPDVYYGNILWEGRFPMRGGIFPPNHPCSPGSKSGPDMQFGGSEALDLFRSKGYWASCFPEGDGISYKPERGQDMARTIADITECFGWIVAGEQPEEATP